MKEKKSIKKTLFDKPAWVLFLKKGKFNHLKSTISAYSIIENLFFYAKAHSWLSSFSHRKKNIYRVIP